MVILTNAMYITNGKYNVVIWIAILYGHVYGINDYKCLNYIIFPFDPFWMIISILLAILFILKELK
jgi:hypothetical protein